MKAAAVLIALLCVSSAHAIVTPSKTMKQNVVFKPLDPMLTDPATFWMPLRNPVPEDYVDAPRYPIVPTPGPIAMDILYGLFPNGTVPMVPAKPTNTWTKNLWGFEFDDYSNWGAIYPYPYIVSPKKGNVNLMYPGAPVHHTDNRAMLDGYFTPEDPSEKPLIFNASYPHMVMSAAFDLGLLIRNGVNVRIAELTEMGAVVEYLDQTNTSVCKLFIVKGSPTINLECTNAILAFGSDVVGVPPIIGCNDSPPGNIVTGSKFRLQSAVGPAHMQAEMWHVYFDTDVSINFPSPPTTPLNVTAPYTGSIQIGVGELGDKMVSLLDQAAGTYATGAKILYDVDTVMNKTNVRFVFTTGGKGTNPLIMLALPHHQMLLSMNTSYVMNATQFWCVKGNLTAVTGTEWVLQYNLTKAGFGDDLKLNASLAPTVLTQARLDYELVINMCPADNATYGYPGFMNMELYAYVRDLAQWTDVAIVLENLGRRDLAVNLTKHIMRCFAFVLLRPDLPPTPCPLPKNNTAVCVRDQMDVYYDQQWGGLVTTWYDRFARGYCECDQPGGPYACIGLNYCDNPTGWNGFSNYGNSFYNDHHFQYGYIMKTLAWVIYYQETLGADLNITKAQMTNISTQALAFARDVANPDPKADMYFPYTRHKDPFDGHSWAEGYSYSGRILTWVNQQSGGESINAYYGVYLLGLALNDTNVMDWGRIQMATEMQSIATYQHLSNRTEALAQLPTPEINKWGKCLSILIGNGGSGATFYGPNVIFECGITILPITPITQEWVNRDWAMEAFDWMSWHVNRSGNCVYPNPVTMKVNPCPGEQNSTWFGNAWGCCGTNEGYPMNQWRAFPDWFPYFYLHLGMKDPAAAWAALQFTDPYTSTDKMPYPYLNRDNQVVGYQPDMSRTQALFFLATLKHNV